MITKQIKIPTGYLFVGDYSKGSLETLSIGDYGKKGYIRLSIDSNEIVILTNNGYEFMRNYKLMETL